MVSNDVVENISCSLTFSNNGLKYTALTMRLVSPSLLRSQLGSTDRENVGRIGDITLIREINTKLQAKQNEYTSLPCH